jgi:hypothetical protein
MKVRMQPPMIGSWTVQVQAAKPYTIHGDLYYQVQAFQTNDPAKSPLLLRIPQHALSTEPAEGQILTVTFLMGQVTSAKVI